MFPGLLNFPWKKRSSISFVLRDMKWEKEDNQKSQNLLQKQKFYIFCFVFISEKRLLSSVQEVSEKRFTFFGREVFSVTKISMLHKLYLLSRLAIYTATLYS